MRHVEPAPDALRDLAAAYAIDTEYWDWQGQAQSVTASTLRAVLQAFDVDASTPEACATELARIRRERRERVLPRCVVVRAGRPNTVAVGAGGAAAARIEFEGGAAPRPVPIAAEPDRGSSEITLPADLPTGYHRLAVELDGVSHTTELIVTPERVSWPSSLDAPAWGLATQLYSVRSWQSWGLGDLADLTTLAAWSAREHGADFVLVNPMHAAEVVAPINPSPYLPTSRRYGNPIYVRIENVPEYACLPAPARAEIDGLADPLRTADAELLDREPVWVAKLAALHRLHEAGMAADRRAAYAAYCTDEGEDLQRFATWCVLSELHGPDWHHWPAALRDPTDAAVAEAAAVHATRVDFFRWLQWLLHEQLHQAQDDALAAGMRLGVIHDLAVGVSQTGADSWAFQHVMATGLTVGAPPDAYSQTGQNWDQPPWRPDRLAELGYAPLRDLFRNTLRHSGGLRVDHIVGLFRLWWIPAGTAADAGTYVHYDHEALIGILALEAERAGAVIIGEDLGNVEPWVRDYLHERGLLGTSILWFESDPVTGAPLPAERWRADCLASVTTHDLPPTTGYLAGDHIRLRDRLGLLTRSLDDELAADRESQAAWIAELTCCGLLPADAAPDEHAIVVALHAFLTRTPARLRSLALTDAVGERRTQNQPGTSDQYPNWQIPLGDAAGHAIRLEDVITDERAAEIAELLR
ncbi:MAG: 4-alpha-glucanotransferase [Jatrophihabitans sp.]|nr:4-alpha-glucanotransferase [Jatrophihabitans sp.]